MRRAIWLLALAGMILITGGCNKPESVKQPAPLLSGQTDQPAKELPQPVVVDKSPLTAATATTLPPPVAPSPSAPVVGIKKTPVEPDKAAPVKSVKPAAKSATPLSAAKSVTYKASNGAVTFSHLMHAANNPCSSCHSSEPPTRILLDKDKAHQFCRGCHQQKGSGPTQCSGCHKKG